MIVSPGEVKITPSHVEITGFVFSEVSRAECALEALRWAQECIEDAKTEWSAEAGKGEERDGKRRKAGKEGRGGL